MSISRSTRTSSRARRLLARGALGLAVVGATLSHAPSATAQTINGTLMDLDSDRPIPLGLVMMFTESGDSIGSTITDAEGRFSMSSPRPGTFMLLAAALGYRETPAGVFELGEDGVMSVEYRLAAEPLAIDELIVALDRPALQHYLVRNGFVRRFQRGFGVFVTPHDIEESAATSTEMLLSGIPGLSVRPIYATREAGPEDPVLILPRPDIGEHVRMRGRGEWCDPLVYVDGARVLYDVQIGATLSQLVPLPAVEGIEVYRRGTEVPAEYSVGQSDCGILVMWTKAGVATGQRVADARVGASVAGSGLARAGRLPAVGLEGPPPSAGEQIRMDLAPEARAASGLGSPWQGEFLAFRDDDLVALDPQVGRAVAVPLSGVEALQVQRERAPIYALRRGAIAGAAFGTGMWLQLRILCRSGCDGVLGSAWLPSAVTSVLFGLLFGAQGPGTQWVGAALPEPEVRPGPGRVDLGVRLPLGPG